MDGNTSATKRKASEEAWSLDMYHQPHLQNGFRLYEVDTWGYLETNSGEGKEEKSKFKGTLAARYRPPWIISKKEDPGHSKNCRKAAKKVF